MCQLRLKGSNGVGQRLLFFLQNWAREQRALLQSKCVTFLKNLHLLQLGDQISEEGHECRVRLHLLRERDVWRDEGATRHLSFSDRRYVLQLDGAEAPIPADLIGLHLDPDEAR